MKGYLSLVLHAHLPFVRHPEHARFLEESWLFEAITETYVPLLLVLNGWQRDSLNAPLTLTLSSASKPTNGGARGSPCCARDTRTPFSTRSPTATGSRFSRAWSWSSRR